MKLLVDNKALPLHEAFVQYLGGIDPARGWEIRGLTGHDIDRSAGLDLVQQAQRQFNERLGDRDTKRAMFSRLIRLYEELKSGRSILEATGRSQSEVHLIVGFMRTGGTFLFKQLMDSVGLDYRHYPQKMTHDSIPSYICCIFEFARKLQTELLLELAQYAYWLEDCWPAQAPLVQKRIAYAHDLPRFGTFFGGPPHWWVTLRDPSFALDSFFKMEGIDPTGTENYPPFWQTTITRFQKQTPERFLAQSNYEKGLDFWVLYHRDLFKSLAAIDPERYTFFPFEDVAQLEHAGSRTINVSGFQYRPGQRPAYLDPALHNRALDRVSRGIEPRFHPWVERYRL